ncbi:MAG: hypothetical protein ACRENK_16460 [Gemmatimonadaceae bacterium]
MSELSNNIRWARIEYQPAEATVALTSFMLPGNQAGLSGADCVQAAVYLATLRDVVASYDIATGGPSARLAIYRDGHQVEYFEGNAQQGIERARQLAGSERAFLVVGNAEFRGCALYLRSDLFEIPVDAWGMKLALALDQVLVRMSTSEQAASPMQAQPAVFPLAAVIVIVTGAAIALIGSVAAWRYFDPDFQRDATLVNAAAESYTARLAAAQATGTMPPVSPIESGAVDAVTRMSSDRKTTDWLWGAGIAGGLIAGTLISVKIAGG